MPFLVPFSPSDARDIAAIALQYVASRATAANADEADEADIAFEQAIGKFIAGDLLNMRIVPEVFRFTNATPGIIIRLEYDGAIYSIDTTGSVVKV